MADTTPIEWTDATWNPITGCTIVDAGCTNCYAMALAGSRLRNHPSRAGLTRVTGGRSKWTGEVRFNEQWLDQPLKWTRPRMIFVCAHGDLFHELVRDKWIDRVFAIMALAPHHTFQVLTKRPERAREYILGLNCDGARRLNIARRAGVLHGDDAEAYASNRPWPLPNVWLGTSASDQASADRRIPELLACPAAVRFVSLEPLLGPVDLEQAWQGESALDSECWGDCAWCEKGFPPLHNCQRGKGDWERGRSGLDWVIVGGESGPGARPMHPDWARQIRDQCVAAGTAFFFKQWGEWGGRATRETRPSWTPGTLIEACTVFGQPAWIAAQDQPFSHLMERLGKKTAGRHLDGRTWDQMPEVRNA